MSRNATFEEVQQPPATREIANVANITHPYVQSEDASTAYIVKTAAKTATVKLFIKDGFSNAVPFALVNIATSGNLDTATPAGGGGALACAAPGGNAPAALSFLAEAVTGHINVPLVFHDAAVQNITVEYGNYRLRVQITTT